MIKKKERSEYALTLDLDGPAGNAFVLLGHAKQLADQLDHDVEAILRQMQSGDYENLVAVFEKYFGDYVLLLRGSEDDDDEEEW